MSGTDPAFGRSAFRVPGSFNILAANRLVLLAAVPLFLVLAVVAYITTQFAANERDAQAWVRHTYQVMEIERRLQDDVQTAETSERGYLISRTPAFLSAYRNFAARAPADLKALRDLTQDNPSEQARAARLRQLINQRIEGMEAGVRAEANIAAAPAPQAVEALNTARGQM